MKPCNCELCVMSRQIHSFKDKLPAGLEKEYMLLAEAMFIRMETAMMDKEVLEAKISGTWPNCENGTYYCVIDGKKYEVKGIRQ